MEDLNCKSIVSREEVKKAQRAKNEAMSDYMNFMVIEKDFNQWFDENITFGFGMGWFRKIARKFCLWGYMAGYKRGKKCI